MATFNIKPTEVKAYFNALEKTAPFEFIQQLVSGMSANKMIALSESILRQVNYEQFKKYGSPLELPLNKTLKDLKAIRTENTEIIQQRMRAKQARSGVTEQVVIEVDEHGTQIGARVDVIRESGRPELTPSVESKLDDVTDKTALADHEVKSEYKDFEKEKEGA